MVDSVVDNHQLQEVQSSKVGKSRDFVLKFRSLAPKATTKELVKLLDIGSRDELAHTLP